MIQSVLNDTGIEENETLEPAARKSIEVFINNIGFVMDVGVYGNTG
jgi:hypothetical protein